MFAGVTAAVRKNKPRAAVGQSQPGMRSKGRAPKHMPKPPKISATPAMGYRNVTYQSSYKCVDVAAASGVCLACDMMYPLSNGGCM